MGLDGRGAARGKRRAAIISELRRHPWVFDEWPGLEHEHASLGRRIEKVARRKPGPVKAGPLSTAAGLLNELDTECIGEIVTSGIAFDEGVGRTRRSDVEGSSDHLIDEVPAIDLPTLAAAVARAGTDLRSFILSWWHRDVNMRIEVEIDLRPTFERGIHVHNLFRSGIPDGGQTIRIAESHGNRIRFVCPLNGQLVDTLFVQDGVVGSRRGLGLKYPCQTIERRRGRMRAAKLAPDPDAHARYRAALERYDMADRDLRSLPPADDQFIENIEKLAGVMLKKGLEGDGNLSAISCYLKLMGLNKPKPVIHKFLDVHESAAFLEVLSAARARAATRLL